MEKPKTITIKLYDKEEIEVMNELERLEKTVWDRVWNSAINRDGSNEGLLPMDDEN